NAVEGRIESTKNIMTRHVEESREWIMDSLHSVRDQKLLRRFFLVYPTATSQRFAKTLEELKKKFHP
ncbi:MAG: hypothetical protein K6C69_00610, partial [Lachnospiraceae bacterium]|nr:hypothetical protein [Lachnospiraceae bacterium]